MLIPYRKKKLHVTIYVKNIDLKFRRQTAYFPRPEWDAKIK